MAKKGIVVQRFTRTPEAHKPLAAPKATKVQGSDQKRKSMAVGSKLIRCLQRRPGNSETVALIKKNN